METDTGFSLEVEDERFIITIHCKNNGEANTLATTMCRQLEIHGACSFVIRAPGTYTDKPPTVN